MDGNVQSAIVYLQQARKFVTVLAQAVVPGVVVKQTVSDGPPAGCTSPSKGLVYFSITRDFDAPDGKTGSALLPALSAQLRAMGFRTSEPESGGAFDVVHATKDDAVGVSAMGSPTTPLVRIGVDTECGRATSADDNVGIEPSASPS